MPPPKPSRAFYTYRRARHPISSTSIRPCNRKHLLSRRQTPTRLSLFSTSGTTSYYRRSDFTGDPYVGSYEANTPLRGPLRTSPPNCVPKVIPRDLKRHLDKFVVGQERAKLMLSTSIFNHHLMVLRRMRLQREEEDRLARQDRIESFRYSYPEHVTSNLNSPRGYRHDRNPERYQEKRLSSPFLEESSGVDIQKSNILMLGPTGVGKTLIVQTLAKVLDVPVVMCDCTPLTQAGYMGEDVESSVGRLLAAADNDPERAENGIIFFDELDKIATAKVIHGKDVSGEGVQQALLKIIEGTTVQINTKQGKGSNRSSSPPTSTLAPKDESYTVKTDNILFIFAGAFVGLDKIVRDRVSKSSIGFGSTLRNTSKDTTPSKAEAALIRKNLPFFPTRPEEKHTILDLVGPEDLHKFGFIPEFIGRIPTVTALTPLSIDDLMRILTDTENSKVSQNAALLQESGVELRFTTPALQVIAQRALDRGTGARGLESVMKNLLTDAMYETPGSSTKRVLVNRAAAKLECAPLYFGRGEEHKFRNAIRQEEEEWEAEKAAERRENEGDGEVEVEVEVPSFEEYREQAKSGM